MAESRRYPYFRELSPELQRQVRLLMVQDEAAGRDPMTQHVSEYIPMVVDQSRSIRAHGGKVCRGRKAAGSAEKAG